MESDIFCIQYGKEKTELTALLSTLKRIEQGQLLGGMTHTVKRRRQQNNYKRMMLRTSRMTYKGITILRV